MPYEMHKSDGAFQRKYLENAVAEAKANLALWDILPEHLWGDFCVGERNQIEIAVRAEDWDVWLKELAELGFSKPYQYMDKHGRKCAELHAWRKNNENWHLILEEAVMSTYEPLDMGEE